MNQQNIPITATPALVLYDDACPLCRTLAGFVDQRGRGAFAVMPWQDFAAAADPPSPQQEKSPNVLRILIADRMLEGTAAWDYLLENYRDMDGLNWMAQKLGLRQEAAVILEKAGHALRRVFCRRCSR